MSPSSSIPLIPLSQTDQGRITQLYRYLELFSEGTPPRQSVFVFAPGSGPISVGESAPRDDQLLIIDPPTNFSQRFRVGNQVAALFTGPPQPTSLALVQTVPGGVAHLRIGDHFLDVYSQRHATVIHLPALGILCGGGFGSDSTLPRLADASDGSDELDTLRLLVRLVKLHRLALYIPRVGSELSEKVAVIERLAVDVAYVNALRRIVTPLAQRGEGLEAIQDLSEDALPRERRTPHDLTILHHNVNALLQNLR